jgi:hypothetical protein
MKTYQNDTYGEITEAELQAMRARAKNCITCGMLATVDPVFHQARYGHQPTVIYGGTTYVWATSRMRWIPVPRQS